MVDYFCQLSKRLMIVALKRITAQQPYIILMMLKILFIHFEKNSNTCKAPIFFKILTFNQNKAEGSTLPRLQLPSVGSQYLLRFLLLILKLLMVRLTFVDSLLFYNSSQALRSSTAGFLNTHNYTDKKIGSAAFLFLFFITMLHNYGAYTKSYKRYGFCEPF